MAKTPEYIGKYKVLERIATGGMGLVYTAEHPTLDRKVIIKRLTLRGDASVRERFRREAQIMMDFQNDYIVNVYDHFREGSYYHIVQEYVDGLSLEQLIERERYLPEEIALRIFRDCCMALDYAHRHKVVHRDIKPSNILVSRTGRVKLVDFGIASIYGNEESSLTREGMTLGTPSYMAPEQFENTRNVDFRADIYSLGVMLYEAVTGKRPFAGGMSADAVQRIQRGRYPRPRSVNPRVSRFVARLIRKTMHRTPARRPDNLSRVMKRVDRRIARIASGAHEARLSDFVAARWTPSAGHSQFRRIAPAVAVVLVLVAVFAAVAAMRAGLHREFFAAEEYGALSIAVRIPRHGPGPYEAGLEAVIYDQENTEVTRVRAAAGAEREASGDADVQSTGGAAAGAKREAPGAADVQSTGETPGAAGTLAGALNRLIEPPARFRREEEASTRRHVAYTSERVYLPAGDYRIKVRLGDRAHWNEIQLQPRSDQRETPATRTARRLVVVAAPWEPVELSAEVTIRDAVSGTELERVTIEYEDDGEWVPFGRVESLESGGTYRFRVDAPGYERRTLEFEVPVYERRLYIDTMLRPIGE